MTIKPIVAQTSVKLIKIGAKVVRHSRYITSQLVEVAIDKRLFAEILVKTERL
jgi:hypothetical protein